MDAIEICGFFCDAKRAYTRRLLIICLSFIPIAAVNAQDTLLAQQLKQYVSFLAADSLKGRFAGTRENRIAADFIKKEMQEIGLKPVMGYENFFAPFLYWGDTLKDIIGAIGGTSSEGEVVIFCAHYDHVGTASTNPFPYFNPRFGRDTIYNGANDNASGVASLLALANLIIKDTIAPLRTILFIAFDGEEIGELDSTYLANLFDPDKVIAVINLEMLGMPDKKNPFITASRFSDIKTILNKTLEQANATLYGKVFFQEDKYLNQNLWKRSDNYPFLLRKIAAHTIMATSANNRLYHTAGDEASTLDYTFMAKVVEAIKIATTPLFSQDTRLKLKF